MGENACQQRNHLANPNAQTKSSKLTSEFCFQANTGGWLSFLVYVGVYNVQKLVLWTRLSNVSCQVHYSMIMLETLIICKNWASVGWLTNWSLASVWFSCSKRACRILNGAPQQPYMCNHITTQCKDYWGMITHAMLQFITILIELPTSLPKINAIKLHVYCLYMHAPNSSLYVSVRYHLCW